MRYSKYCQHMQDFFYSMSLSGFIVNQLSTSGFPNQRDLLNTKMTVAQACMYVNLVAPVILGHFCVHLMMPWVRWFVLLLSIAAALALHICCCSFQSWFICDSEIIFPVDSNGLMLPDHFLVRFFTKTSVNELKR